jgi:hypothetical protein
VWQDEKKKNGEGKKQRGWVGGWVGGESVITAPGDITAAAGRSDRLFDANPLKGRCTGAGTA